MARATRRRIRKSLTTNFDPGLSYYKQRAILRATQAAHWPGWIAGGHLDRPVFVLGAPRSGTTLLYRVLRAHPDLAHWRPSEAHEVWELDYHPSLRGWESNVLTTADVTEDAARRIRRSFYLVAGRRRRFVDKTPRNTLRVPFMNALFPDAHYVFLTRDGRENVNSLINAWRSPRYRVYRLPQPHSIPGTDPRWWKFVLYPGWQEDTDGPLEVVCARQWALSNRYALDGAREVEDQRWITVRYEDLVDAPLQEVGRLLENLGLPPDEEVSRRTAAIATTPVNYVTLPERGKWKRENPEEIERIYPIIEAEMQRLGYAT